MYFPLYQFPSGSRLAIGGLLGITIWDINCLQAVSRNPSMPLYSDSLRKAWSCWTLGPTRVITHCSRRIALCSEEGQANFHVVEGAETGCNSLRPPDIEGRTRPMQVAVATLDQFLRQNAIQRVDFMKMDIEGAELSALRGAASLLRTLPRPVLLIEVFEIRTRPWGYSSRDIVKILTDAGYLLYRPAGNGDLETMDPGQDRFDANLIVVPKERISEIANFLSVQEVHSCLPSK